MRVAVIACVALIGCYQPPTGACGIVCTDTCPGDLVCTPQHVCRAMDGSCGTPPIDFASVGVGSRHVCGLDVLGSIWCWGDNSVGQLGTPGLELAAVPTLVGDATTTWTEVSVGSEHTCGLTAGQVLCWGQNADGQVAAGKGGTFDTPTSPQFAGAPPVFDHVAAGGAQTCALASGQLWCWGKDPASGAGATSVPTRVGMLDDWTQVSAGFDHTCGISASQGVLCWGANGHHQTGDPTATTVAMPQPVAMPMPATKVVAGDLLTCAILVDGTLWCWGFNNGSSLIDPSLAADPATPTQIGTEGGWTAIAMSSRRACGVRDGVALCWGTSYALGGLGDGYWYEFQIHHDAARQIGSADAVALGFEGPAFARQDEFGCLLAGTHVQCWGENAFGELGVGSATRHLTPVEIASPSGAPWAHVYSGDNHTCAVTITGELDCWGGDFFGQVGAGVARGEEQPCIDGQTCDRPTPELAPAGIDRFDELVAGHDYTCTRHGATVQCWGDSNFAQLGNDGASGHTVVEVEPPSGAWTRILGGTRATCGTTTTGVLACWGDMNGEWLYVPTDKSDPQLHDLASIALADDSTCATRTSDASRVCWGGNSNGQLGNGSTLTDSTITAYDVGTVAQVAARTSHACAITTTGGVTCWGSNGNREAGIATGNMITSPVVVSAQDGPLHGCTALALGPDYSCAICNATATCWGRTRNASTGRRTIAAREVADLVGLPNDLHVVELAAGTSRACALDDTGRLFCWGDGPHGEIGDGGHASPFPVPVHGP